jgi:hypothetical protein
METYHLHLLKGSFEKEDALRLLSEMIDTKIKYHEDKIRHSDAEEDIKLRETRIKQLQKELHDARLHLQNKSGRVELFSEIQLS